MRPVVEAAVAGLSKRSGLEVSKVLDVKPAHVGGLLSRPLHTRHIDLQTQVVCILNFCLSTHPEPLMRIHAQLVGLLQEALALAENDDPTAIKAGPGATESLHALRAACIRLMCSAMACPELKAPAAGQEQLAQLRQRIITMFFKSLTSRSTEVVDIAKQGLKRVIQQQSLSKELLQSSLRPILVNLAHYKNLTMPLLSGLERLLELLSNWFNPTLGEKLLEHLRRWLEPDAQKQAAGQPPQQARAPPKDFKIAAAMINLFHLLPQAAGKFLEPLVMLTMQLEQALPQSGVHSEVNSLYRKPLTKFLARYASDTVDFFLARLAQPAFFLRFLDMIRMKEGENIRAELAASAPKIIAAAFTWPRPGAGTNPAADAQASEGLSGVGGGSDLNAYNGLKLISTLAKRMPDWLKTQPELVKALWGRWSSEARAQRLASEEMLAHAELVESKLLVKCFVNVVDRDHEKVKYLFDVLSIFDAKTRVDFTFLVDFYKDVVPATFTPEERRAVLMYFLTAFKKRTLTPPELVSALRLVVLPMLEHTLKDVATDAAKMEEAKLVVTEEAVESIVVDLLETADDEDSDAHTEPMRIQLLKMGTLLIRSLPDELVRHRKELIKFGWNHLKSEDSGAKQWAFVNVCHFWRRTKLPEKIVLQVFVALLRACQPEAKELVRQALGALVPALPKRLPQGDHKYPIWIATPRRSSSRRATRAALIHVWNLIHTQESLFFPSRAQLCPQMVNSYRGSACPPPPHREQGALDQAGGAHPAVGGRASGSRRNRREARARTRTTRTTTASEQPKKSLERGQARPRRDTRSSKRPRVPTVRPPPRTRRRGRGGGGGGAEDDRPEGKKEEPISLESAEKGDVDMADVEDIDIGDGKSDKDKAAPASAADVDDFTPTPAMEEILVNFLVRMSFLTGEAKDKEMVALPARRDAAEKVASHVADVNIKFAFIEKLLASATATAGSDRRTSAHRPRHLQHRARVRRHQVCQRNAPQLGQMLEPCFRSRRNPRTTRSPRRWPGDVPADKPLAGAVEDESGRPVPPAERNSCRTSSTSSAPSTSRRPSRVTPRFQTFRRRTRLSRASSRASPPSPSASVASWTDTCPTSSSCCPGSRTSSTRRRRGWRGAAAAARAGAPGQAPRFPCRTTAPWRTAWRRACDSSRPGHPAGGEHKQLFLRMLLQLINDQATHGAVLMATLDALKGWAEDAVAERPRSRGRRGGHPRGPREAQA